MKYVAFCILRCLAAALVAAALVACVGVPAGRARSEFPALRLSPASLGGSLALHQLLTVSARGQTHRFDVLLEADATSVRLAVLNLGQTAARLEWDGAELRESRQPWWPEAVGGARILGDLQLMYWPPTAIGAALPAGWRLEATGELRQLYEGSELVASVRVLGPQRAELANLRDGYRILVESRALESAP